MPCGPWLHARSEMSRAGLSGDPQLSGGHHRTNPTHVTSSTCVSLPRHSFQALCRTAFCSAMGLPWCAAIILLKRLLPYKNRSDRPSDRSTPSGGHVACRCSRTFDEMALVAEIQVRRLYPTLCLSGGSRQPRSVRSYPEADPSPCKSHRALKRFTKHRPISNPSSDGVSRGAGAECLSRAD